ncbi:MAG: hypothetical protein ABL917_01805, partial [Parcubacteria group bacterium]
VIGDLIEGTVGQTERGKRLGLNNINIPSVALGAPLSSTAGFGKGGTVGYRDEKAAGDKVVRDRNAANAAELSAAESREKVLAGSKTGALPAEIEEMEKALAKMSDKQTEALVAGNRDLLNSLNFANSISVKQLEAINKSDQFSDSEKSNLKDRRFEQIKTIHDPAALMAYTAAIAVPAAARTPAQIADIKKVEDARARVRGLSDSELEMIDPGYFDTSASSPTRPQAMEFISQLKQSQADTITTNKNGKFTSSQTSNVRKHRAKPLMDALTSGVAADIKREIKKADIKTKVSYMKTNGPAGIPIALDNNVLDTYDIKTLQRMALHENMTDGDISDLRSALLNPVRLARIPAGNPVVAWLNDPNKGVIEFPA